jgi:phenylacetate-CoA ligase
MPGLSTYETMTRDALEQVQLERLQATLTRVERNVAFCHNALAAAGVSPEDVATLADLSRLPFTTKDDLRKSYPYDMFAVPLHDIVRIQSTSGTTGSPVVVGYTRNDIRTWSECVARVLTAGGVTEHDVVQVAFGYGLFTGGLGFHYGAERIGASVIPASTGALDKQVLIMKDFKTTALACTPGYAAAIADAVARAGIHPERLSLKTAFLGAEPFSESLRGQIETALRVKVYDNYGLTEILGPGVSFECGAGCGLHVNEDHFIVEVIDPATGAPVADGTEGELVFTTITKEGFPLLRYRTGDLAVLDRAPCACGRTLARMSRVQGRMDDMIIMGASKLFPSQVEQVVLGVPGLQPHFEIILDRENGMDLMTVRVEISETMPGMDELKTLEAARTRVARELEALAGTAPRVVLAEPRSIARQLEGKTRRVTDLRRR